MSQKVAMAQSSVFLCGSVPSLGASSLSSAYVAITFTALLSSSASHRSFIHPYLQGASRKRGEGKKRVSHTDATEHL